VKVRPALPSDEPRYAELMAVFTDRPLTPKACRNRFALIASHPDHELIVATVQDAVVGMLVFRIRHNFEEVSHYGEIATIVVDPDWRQRGTSSTPAQASPAPAPDSSSRFNRRV
jgi:ribosomal protein S18 acetylase RimI-like enzyme